MFLFLVGVGSCLVFGIDGIPVPGIATILQPLLRQPAIHTTPII